MGIINWYYYQAWRRNTKAAEDAEKEKKRKEEDAKKQKQSKQKPGHIHPAQGRNLYQGPMQIPSQALEDLVDELE